MMQKKENCISGVHGFGLGRRKVLLQRVHTRKSFGVIEPFYVFVVVFMKILNKLYSKIK